MKVFGRGLLRAYILGAARFNPVSGMEIINQLNESTSGRWKPSPGSVYPIFKLFGKQGFLKKASKRDKEVKYLLTAKGKKLFEKEREECFVDFMITKDALLPVVFKLMLPKEDEELEKALDTLIKVSSAEMHRMLALSPEKRIAARRNLIILVAKVMSRFYK